MRWRVVPSGQVTLSLKTLERLLRTIREQKETIMNHDSKQFQIEPDHINHFTFKLALRSGNRIEDRLVNINRYIQGCQALYIIDQRLNKIVAFYDEANPK